MSPCSLNKQQHDSYTVSGVKYPGINLNENQQIPDSIHLVLYNFDYYKILKYFIIIIMCNRTYK